jgi:hypothetical protein
MKTKFNRRDFLVLFVGTNLSAIVGGNYFLRHSSRPLLEAALPEQPVYSVFKIKTKAAHLPSFQQFKGDKNLIDFLPNSVQTKAWFKDYNLTRDDFIKDERLLETSKVIENDSLVIVNKWRSQADYESFCADCKIDFLLHQLHEDFIFDYSFSAQSPEVLVASGQVIFNKKYA